MTDLKAIKVAIQVLQRTELNDEEKESLERLTEIKNRAIESTGEAE